VKEWKAVDLAGNVLFWGDILYRGRLLTNMTNSILDHLFLSNILETAEVVTPN
jgi:hypothetical protein